MGYTRTFTKSMKGAIHPAYLNKTQMLLLVEHMDGGKTQFTRVVGVMERGIVMIITPLLALSADQKARFVLANQ